MVTRFSLALIFAVLVAASRPLATGGNHDLVAVGVVTESPAPGGGTARRTALALPTEEALAAFDALMETPARPALLQGSGVTARVPGAAGPGTVELVFYGHGSRAGRSAVALVPAEGAGAAPGSAEALAAEAARALSALPPTVTAAAARVLLHSKDDGAFRDAIEALADVRADVAAAEARAAALSTGSGIPRRIIAIGVLRRLGGPGLFPDVFEALGRDPDPVVRDAAD